MAVSTYALIALTALAGCAFVDHRADRREARALAQFPPSGQIIEVEGRKVHAVVSGQGPDLVLIHGASGNLRDMTFELMGRLDDRYRVIALDRPGLGFSDPVDAAAEAMFSARADSPSAQAALLQAAAAQLGADRPIVLGHSFGGAVAMAWALDRPDNIAALVDVSGATMPWEGGLGALYDINGSSLGGALVPPLITAFATQAMVDDTLSAIFAPNPVPAGYADHVGAALAMRRDSLRVNARQVSTLLPHVTEMSARYADLDLPVEIVHGDTDTIVPLDVHSRKLAGLIPDAHLTVVRNVGHMPHHVTPQLVVDAIDRAARRAGLR